MAYPNYVAFISAECDTRRNDYEDAGEITVKTVAKEET